jgi:type I restriction enzyme S subunit
VNIKNKRLPDGWQWVKLGELAIAGPSNGIFKQRHEFGRGVPIVNVYDLYRSLAVDLNAVERVEVSDKELRSYAIAPGDLFFCRSSLKREGIGWCCYVRDVPEPAVFDCHVMRVRLNPEKADSEFVAYYWRHPDVRKEVIKNSRTATMTTMNQEDLSNVDILLPPLAEQKRIAAIAQKADRLRRTRRYALQLSDTYLQSVFLEMFGGKASEDLPFVKVESLVKSGKNKIRTGPFGSQLLHSEFIENGQIAVLGIDNVVQNYFTWDKRRFITDRKYQELKRYRVYPGDVLITIMGTCGKCAIAPENLPIAINTKHLCCITLEQTKCLPTYLQACFLRHPLVLKQLGVSERGAVMPGLNMNLIQDVEIPLPPLPLQEKFAQIVQKFERLRTQQREGDRQAEHLFQTLLHRAFRGELTPQDSNDEVASVLLEQIGTEQEKVGTTHKTKGISEKKSRTEKHEAAAPEQLRLPGF